MNEAAIWRFLKSQGMTDAGAAGLMGNLFAESGLNPKNLQNTYEKSLGYTDETYTAAVDSGRYTNFVHDKAGYGLAQWTYWSRKQALYAFCKAIGASIGDLDAQLKFLMKELSESFPGVLLVLRSVTSVHEASNVVLLQFERPASKDTEATQTKRAGYGQTYFNQFAVVSAEKGDGATMKYTSANPPMKCFMRQSSWYKSTGKVPVRGVLWHSTGANNTTLRRYVQPDDNAADRAKMLELISIKKNKKDA